MKLGRDFFFWAKILIAILRAIVRIMTGQLNGDQEPGEVIVEAVLDVVIDTNEDDKLTSVKDLLGRIDPAAPGRNDNLSKIDKDLKTKGRKTA